MDLFPLVFCAFSSSAAATPQVRRRAASEDAEWKGPPCTPACAGLSVPASSDNACQLPQLAPLFIFICPPSHPGKAGLFDPCRPVWPSCSSRARTRVRTSLRQEHGGEGGGRRNGTKTRERAKQPRRSQSALPTRAGFFVRPPFCSWHISALLVVGGPPSALERHAAKTPLYCVGQ